jgi:hypothetical protein
MALPKWLGIVRVVLGKITDVLTLGRSAGLWTEKPGIGTDSKGAPHRPDMGKR